MMLLYWKDILLLMAVGFLSEGINIFYTIFKEIWGKGGGIYVETKT